MGRAGEQLIMPNYLGTHAPFAKFSHQTFIRTDGGIVGLTVLSTPDPTLADAAVDAVRQWRYQPTLLNGQPVEVVTTISVNFRLDQ